MSRKKGKRRRRKPWYHLTWQRFWIAYAVLAVLVAIPGTWMAYQDWTWPQRYGAYESRLQTTIQSLQGASPQQVADALNLGAPEATRQQDNGQYVAMRWPTPFPHYYVQLTFRDGGLERGSVVVVPDPLTGESGVEHTLMGRALKMGGQASLMVAPFVWLLFFAVALFSRHKRKLGGHVMLGLSIPWSLAGLADHALRGRRLNLLDPEELGVWALWLLPVITSAVVAIWA